MFLISPSLKINGGIEEDWIWDNRSFMGKQLMHTNKQTNGEY